MRMHRSSIALTIIIVLVLVAVVVVAWFASTPRTLEPSAPSTTTETAPAAPVASGFDKIVVSVCPNLSGTWTLDQVRSVGMIIDQNGDCVRPKEPTTGAPLIETPPTGWLPKHADEWGVPYWILLPSFGIFIAYGLWLFSKFVGRRQAAATQAAAATARTAIGGRFGKALLILVAAAIVIAAQPDLRMKALEAWSHLISMRTAECSGRPIKMALDGTFRDIHRDGCRFVSDFPIGSLYMKDQQGLFRYTGFADREKDVVLARTVSGQRIVGYVSYCPKHPEARGLKLNCSAR